METYREDCRDQVGNELINSELSVTEFIPCYMFINTQVAG